MTDNIEFKIPSIDQLRKMRIMMDITQEEAAEAVGVSKTTVFSWENGDTEPRLSQYKKLAKFYESEWNQSDSDDRPGSVYVGVYSDKFHLDESCAAGREWTEEYVEEVTINEAKKMDLGACGKCAYTKK